MAGIGFVLRKLAQRDDFTGVLTGYFYAAIISSGPWLFTVISLGLLVIIGNQFMSIADLTEFRIIIIYNFSFSLVLSAPVSMVATRCLADMIYAHDASAAPGVLLGILAFMFAIVAPLVVAFYVIYADLDPWVRIAAIINYFLITGIWLINIFMSALKEYASIARTFGLVMLLALLGSILLSSDFSVPGMLMGFNLGLAFIFFNLIARVLAEFPGSPRKPFTFLRYFQTHWEIALSGMIYNLGVWVDKWIMWFAPERIMQDNKLISYPHYDGAMFLAYLSIVPAIALFTFSIETSFYEKYLRFYQDIRNHAPYDRIKRNAQLLWDTVLDSSRSILLLQLTIGISLILIAPAFLAWIKASPMQLGIFRFGILGAIFHANTMFLIILLSYFDVRMKVLLVATVFFLANSILTWLSMKLGIFWYGWGYAMASIISFGVAYLLLNFHIRQLPYETFIVKNTSVRLNS